MMSGILLDEIGCTGIAAVWCPRCGDCVCARLPSGERDFERDFESRLCPLHDMTSRHAEPPQDRGTDE